MLRETEAFRLIEKGNRYYIIALRANSSPKTLRVSRDAAYDMTERISLSEFNGACVFSGCGVFASARS